MDARSTVTAKEGDRYPLRPPNLFRKIRARCMDLTVNQWLGEFDPHMRSQSMEVCQSPVYRTSLEN